MIFNEKVIKIGKKSKISEKHQKKVKNRPKFGGFWKIVKNGQNPRLEAKNGQKS